MWFLQGSSRALSNPSPWPPQCKAIITIYKEPFGFFYGPYWQSGLLNTGVGRSKRIIPSYSLVKLVVIVKHTPNRYADVKAPKATWKRLWTSTALAALTASHPMTPYWQLLWEAVHVCKHVSVYKCMKPCACMIYVHVCTCMRIYIYVHMYIGDMSSSPLWSRGLNLLSEPCSPTPDSPWTPEPDI